MAPQHPHVNTFTAEQEQVSYSKTFAEYFCWEHHCLDIIDIGRTILRTFKIRNPITKVWTTRPCFFFHTRSCVGRLHAAECGFPNQIRIVYYEPDTNHISLQQERNLVRIWLIRTISPQLPVWMLYSEKISISFAEQVAREDLHY